MHLKRTLNAVIRLGEESGYVAECLEPPVVTQGRTLDEVAANLREAVSVHLTEEDLATWGLAEAPILVVTFELEPAVAQAAPARRTEGSAGPRRVRLRGAASAWQSRQAEPRRR